MTSAYVPNVDIPLQNDEDETTFYTFNPSHFQYGSQSVTLDYFNSLILQQQQADQAAAAATSATIAAQASSMASSNALLSSGIGIAQAFIATNTAGDVIQSQDISDLQDTVTDLSNAFASYALLNNPTFLSQITLVDLSMSGNVILANEDVISQEQLGFLSTISSNVQTQFADLATSIATAESNTSTLETSINSQIVDISAAMADIAAEVTANTDWLALIQGNVTTQGGYITTLQSDLTANSSDILALQTDMGNLAAIDSPSFTTQITTPQIVLNGSIITNSTNISPVELSYLNNASSNIQNQIDNTTTVIGLKADALDAVLTGNATCVTQADANNSTRLANTQFVQTAIANLVNGSPSLLNSLSEIAAAINNDENFSTTMATLIGTKAPNLNATMTGNTSFANIAVSGTTSFAANSIGSTAINNTHFSTLSTAQTISGAKSFTGLSTVNKMCENFYSMGTLGSTTASIDFANGSCFYFTPFSSSNIALAITNVPTSNTSCTYSITSLINTSTYKVCGNTCTVNGNATTLVASGGIASLLVDPSASFIIQQITLCFDGSTNPSRVISSVNSFF